MRKIKRPTTGKKNEKYGYKPNKLELLLRKFF